MGGGPGEIDLIDTHKIPLISMGAQNEGKGEHGS
jgi:hypothetical protein